MYLDSYQLDSAPLKNVRKILSLCGCHSSFRLLTDLFELLFFLQLKLAYLHYHKPIFYVWTPNDVQVQVILSKLSLSDKENWLVCPGTSQEPQNFKFAINKNFSNISTVVHSRDVFHCHRLKRWWPRPFSYLPVWSMFCLKLKPVRCKFHQLYLSATVH